MKRRLVKMAIATLALAILSTTTVTAASYNPRLEPITPPLADGDYMIVSKVANKPLDVSGWSQLDGGNVQIWDKHGGANQIVKVVRRSYLLEVNSTQHEYEIIFAHSGKSLDVSGASKDSKANVQQYKSNGTNAQRWYIISCGGGWYKLVAKCSDKVLDVSGGNTENGTNIWQYDDNGTDAQRFKFVKASHTHEYDNYNECKTCGYINTTKALTTLYFSTAKDDVPVWNFPRPGVKFGGSVVERIGKKGTEIKIVARAKLREDGEHWGLTDNGKWIYMPNLNYNLDKQIETCVNKNVSKVKFLSNFATKGAWYDSIFSCEWDFKTSLTSTRDYNCIINGKLESLNGDQIGNIIYGYVGRAIKYSRHDLLNISSREDKNDEGFSKEALGACVVDMYKAYCANPGDNEAVQSGMDYFETGKFIAPYKY